MTLSALQRAGINEIRVNEKLGKQKGFEHIKKMLGTPTIVATSQQSW